MKERPIIFNAEMVRAILDGRKTQTRRLVPEWQLPRLTKQDPGDNPDSRWMAVAQRHPRWGFGVFGATEESCAAQLTESLCPFGCRNDRLWMRECHAQVLEVDIPKGRPVGPIGTAGSPARPDWKSRYVYRADGEMPNVQWHHLGDSQPVRWTPSIHMPRKAARGLLEITGARVERLNAISEDDAMAEGVPPAGHLAQGSYLTPKGDFATAKVAFQRLWESIYGEESWRSNPWVWVIEFKRVEGGAAC